MDLRFYKCNKCGQMIAKVKNTNVPIICCGEEMKEIIPHTDDGDGYEKHLPVYEIKKDEIKVKIGSNLHPYTMDHYIDWVAIVTNKGNQRKEIKPLHEPVVKFALLDDEKVKYIYSYCNIHGLWKLDVEDEENCGCDLFKK